MGRRAPILLSFYALSGGDTTLLFGQITYTKPWDFSFRSFSRRKTFRTLVRLYQTRPYINKDVLLEFGSHTVKTTTNIHGAFYIKVPNFGAASLTKVSLLNGEVVHLMPDLYPSQVQEIKSDVIVVSDIDDTLMQSHIIRKLRKFRTLMLTSLEQRKAVENMQDILSNFVSRGAQAFYLSNSEQNLYPLIYRFLSHNSFPGGPIFLKQMRSLWDVIRNIKFPIKTIHKTTVLEELFSLFPGKRFVLMGDNTQQDLSIYLTVAEKYPQQIESIIIRKVVEREEDFLLIRDANTRLQNNPVKVYYAESFPELMSVV